MPRNAAPVKFISEDEEEDDSQEEYCTVKRRKGVKVYECTGCRYTSERRSNVGRHFRRIHCELKRHKRCVCDEVFLTKGEYYEHCVKEHPHLRHSSFITTEKYKIGKSKSKTRSGLKRVLSQAEVVEVRSSPRLAANQDQSTKTVQLEEPIEKIVTVQVSMEKNNNDNDGILALPAVVETGSETELEEPIEKDVTVQVSVEKNNNDNDERSALPATVNTIDFNSSKSIEPLEAPKMNVYEDTHSPQPSASCKRMGIAMVDNVKSLEPSAEKENNQLRLPPKKRFMSSTVFADITNNNSNNIRNNQFNEPSVIVRNNNAIQFIDQIDFDDLDAILSLAHMRYLY